jgi:long-chain fatty acid transport protein
MKKFLLSIAAVVAITISASAEGYQVNTLSAKQIGMGHTGVALKLGSESMFFNPAGMASMDKMVDFSASISPIFATAKATSYGETYTTDNTPSTPISAFIGFSIYRNLKAGIAFYTPYGSGINWGSNWAGSVLNQSVTLAAYTLQPTLAWQVTPKFSIGAGLMMTWGKVDLDKGLLPSGILPQLPGITPASVNLKGSAAMAFGVNVGAQYDITSQWTVGVAFRSKMNMTVKKGVATVSYATEAVKNSLESQIGLIDQANFTSTMPCVSVLNFGVSYKPTSRWTIAADAQLSFWDEYNTLDIEFALPEAMQQRFNQYIDKNYRNSWTFHVGAEWAATRRFDVRAGMMIDTAPMSTDLYNPETPGMTKLEPSVGFSFRPIACLSINAAFMYVAGLGVDNATCSYANMLTGTSAHFTADYRVKAFIPSVGVSLNF